MSVDMQTSIPFYSNTKDNTHCFQAVYRMILKHFFPKKNFTWKELDTLSGKKKGKWTWQTTMLINMKKMGFDIVSFDTFDFHSFIKKGAPFLIEVFGEEIGNQQIINSDVEYERSQFKKVKGRITVKKKPATLQDIRTYLSKGHLIECQVNACALNKEVGYSGHSVMIYDFDKKYFYLHDPGLRPMPARKVTYALLKKSMAPHYSFTAVRLKKKK